MVRDAGPAPGWAAVPSVAGFVVGALAPPFGLVPFVGGVPPAGGCNAERPCASDRLPMPGVVWNDASSARPPIVAKLTVTTRRTVCPLLRTRIVRNEFAPAGHR